MRADVTLTITFTPIPVINTLFHLPIVGDPSHATGRRDKVMPLARAVVAAGGDGLLIGVHHEPDKAVCDGPQSLYPEQFTRLIGRIAHYRARGGAEFVIDLIS